MGPDQDEALRQHWLRIPQQRRARHQSAKMVLGAMVAAMGFAVGISGPAHAADILVNGGFETGDFTGWVTLGNFSFTGVRCPGPLVVSEGNCDAFLGADINGSFPVQTDGTLAQGLNTLPGRFYNISFDFEPGSSPAFPDVPSDFSAFWGGVPLVSLTNPPAGPYHVLSFNAPATAANTTLTFNFFDDPGFLHLDAVLVSIPEPGTMALLGIGMAGLWWRRRQA